MSRSRVLLLILALVVIVLLSVVYIPEDQVAVRESYDGGAVPLLHGAHLRLPIMQRIYRYDTRPVNLDEPITIVTRDNATFKLPIRISAWTSAGDVVTFHKARAGREPVTFIKEQVRDAVLRAVKAYNADTILTEDGTRRLIPSISADLIARGIANDSFSVGRPSPQVVLNAVLDYLRRRFPASARRLAESALALDPRESLYHTAMGSVLEAEGKKSDAEKAYLDALFLDPASPEPMSRLYVIYQSSNDAATIARLERLLTASLEKNQNSPVHNDWLGQVYMREGRLDKADMAFKSAVGQAPNEPQFRVSLGSLRIRQGKLDEARAALDEALKIKPEMPLALFDLGTTYAIQAQYDKAIEYFRRAERAGPPNHALFNMLAQAYEEKGELDHAAQYLRRSIDLKPDQPDRKSELARIEARLRAKGKEAAPRRGAGAAP
ncbi:MAG TPA: tetratricopeptide repeat protein [Candidatus Polarisedimenticolia bacterium]|nr:tetratricopeptide repeat protein [Candidatus Polarisedimenticolia bacterium]